MTVARVLGRMGWVVLALGFSSPAAAATPPWASLPAGTESDPRAVRLQAAEFMAGAPPAIPDGLRGEPVERGGWLLVQFAPSVSPARRVAILESHHALVGDTIPNHLRIARVPAAEVAPLAAEPGVTWLGRLHPAFKLSRLLPEAAPWRLDLALAADADPDLVAAALSRLARITVVEARPGRLRIETDDGGVPAAAARMDEVTFVEETPEAFTVNDQVRWILQSGTPGVYSIHGHGVRGSSQTVAIMDTGIDTKHCCFSARGKIKSNKAYGGGTVGAECSPDHGTHTSGTMACSNNGDHDGMAPDSPIVMQDIGKGGLDCILGGVHPPSPLSTAWNDAYSAGARVHSNSWNGGGNAYTSDTQSIDQYIWDHQDFLIMYAAGNSGPGAGSLQSYSNAKNSITVGATVNGTGDNDVASFSSQGPAGDGRMLPDVLAPGDGVSSSYNGSGCGWVTESGTSMATPGITGSAALVRDYFSKGFYPSGSANSPDGFSASAALVKATLLASTRDVTGAYSGGDRPNFAEGFGRVTLDDALWFSGDPTNQRLIVLDDRNTATGFTNAGQTATFTVHVQQAGPLKVMLVWSDAPGSPSASKQLVNDLDLDVTTPDQQVFAGNQGFNGGWTTAPSSTHDNLNNKEAVFLANVVPGDVTIRVTAAALGNATSAHPQDYALVALAPSNPFCSAAPATGVGDSVTLQASGADYIATWADRGADHYVVYRGDTPSFYGLGVPPYQDNIHDADPTTPGIQWTDPGAAADGQNHYYLFASVNACGDVTP